MTEEYKSSFELVKVGSVGEKKVLSYMCRRDVHKMSMTEEQAKENGLRDQWKDGFVFSIAWASIYKGGLERIEVKRTGKRPKVLKVHCEIVRCDLCGYSESRYVASPRDELFQEASLRMS